MVADFVNQHMGHDLAERFVVLRPVIQDGAAVEPDHIRHRGDIAVAAERQPNALKQAKQVEFAFSLHFAQHVVGREVVHLDDHTRTQLTKMFWQPRERVVGHGFHLSEGR